MAGCPTASRLPLARWRPAAAGRAWRLSSASGARRAGWQDVHVPPAGACANRAAAHRQTPDAFSCRADARKHPASACVNAAGANCLPSTKRAGTAPRAPEPRQKRKAKCCLPTRQPSNAASPELFPTQGRLLVLLPHCQAARCRQWHTRASAKHPPKSPGSLVNARSACPGGLEEKISLRRRSAAQQGGLVGQLAEPAHPTAFEIANRPHDFQPAAFDALAQDRAAAQELFHGVVDV